LSSEPKKEEVKTFTAQVQVGFRVQIPEAVRIVLGISEGDFVDVTIKKIAPKPAEEKKEEAKPTS
jgi:bifunctional DNA-binding transcriptional regulator/antitoxin component of YhaV-PrlF toxin-antitoxin module